MCDLGIKHSLLVGVDLKGCQHVDLLDQKQRSILFTEFLGNLCKELCCLSVLVGFPVEFDRFHLLVFLDKVVGVLCQELLDLNEAMLLGQLHCQVPLVEEDAAVNRFLGVSELGISVYSLLAESH